jgi:hypothetical protein
MNVRRVVVASMVLTIVLTTMGTGWANNGFDDRSLRGIWGFSASGRVLGQQAAAVGLITADGQGVCTTSARLNVNGQVATLVSSACTYEVNVDGTGQINSTFPTGPSTSVSFLTDLVIIKARKEFHFIVSDDPNVAGGTVANGVAKRQGD